MLRRLLIVVALLLAAPAYAQDTAATKKDEVRQFIESLHFQTGKVAVSGAHATLNLNPDFRFLDAHDAQRVLEQLWGNPPDSDVLGMLVPTSKSLPEKDAWAVVITFVADGYVSDADAAKTDYAKILKDMQQESRDANAERTKRGYPAVEIVGWATPPHYDAAANKIYWARELDFTGSHEHTLNYDIRVLGRSGYLSLNAVAGMNQLDTVQTQMPNVLAMTEFDQGQRYSDFNASTDKVAAYGIGALVAGAIAAKAGLFAKLLVLLIAAKKVIFVGIAAIGAAIAKFFKRKAD
ncbi:MAG: DUF2167 domain-containing protein [Gammaproteobacteria bacterium]|nr:MAG: DUF2167 domain-containing protein [Gammaproteobacteria bacterium]